MAGKAKRLNKVDHMVAEHQLKKSLKPRLNNFSKSSISLFNKIFTKEDSYFFISSYLPLKSDLKLQFILGQFPKIN